MEDLYVDLNTSSLLLHEDKYKTIKMVILKLEKQL